jgi:allantoate deiminase
VEHLPSGAGHDAAAMAAIAPWAMLFVRCYKGISHDPDESIDSEDAAVALEVMNRFLKLLVEEKKNGGKILERT